MASATKRRVNSRSEGYSKVSYVEGNTARSVQAVPAREPQRITNPKRRRRVSRAAHKNRAKALQMSKGYVVFLAIICTATLFACVQFLQLKAEMTARSKEVASQETKLSKLKADNDALFSETLASLDLDNIRKIAINQLGMNYPREDQIVRYSTTGNSYVRQYKDVPDTK